MKEEDSAPSYPRKQAASLICICYNAIGSRVEKDKLLKSILEDYAGDLPDGWNAGLFRFLDEAIYLFRIVEYFALSAVLRDRSVRAQLILAHQIGRNLSAIRFLAASGHDGPARQNLRALSEICRCLIDPDLMRDFADQPTLQSANEFWHRYLAKQRTEKYLKEYNRTASKKCALVERGDDDSHAVMGVGAHPNYHAWAFDLEAEHSDQGGVDKMFHFSSDRATEFLLANACLLSLTTLSFCSEKIAEIAVPLRLLENNPIFKHFSDDIAAVHGIGRASGLMVLMLVKLTNRQKSDFDEQIYL
jgi:hypothetical protein